MINLTIITFYFMKEFWGYVKMIYTEGGVATWVATFVVIAAVAVAIWVSRERDDNDED